MRISGRSAAAAPRRRRRGRSWRGSLGAALRYALLTLGAVAMLLPFADTVIGALRTPAELLARPPAYWPGDPAWTNFRRVFTELPMLLWLGNSALVTVSITAIQLLTSSMAGFALAKYRFPGREALLRVVLAAQIVPFFLLVIPIFLLIRYWPLVGGNDLFGQGGSGFLGSYVALILPFAVSWYGIFLMRQFMLTIPDELLDAARIDGASELRILFRIVLPLAKPALATLGIFVFIYQWNEIIWTMTVTRAAPALQTVPVGIYLLRNAFDDVGQQSLQQAAIAVSTAPVLILFLLLQRYYVRGINMSGLKG
ncbi:carbohydrate ABC transporter permease [Roseomonas sp. BN140053]|uniref:carbohydrate ABC transporter permease n=1 Tax=Roseomonas sp. BN140053 TaxID=3391898 RepID=UPI0039EA56D0